MTSGHLDCAEMTLSQLRRAITPEAKSARRAAITGAAAALLRENGRADFSMETLAARAGLAKGTVYLYFRTREEVLLAVHEQLVHELFDAFAAALALPDASPAKVLAAGLQHFRQHPETYVLAGNCRHLLENACSTDAAVAFKRGLGPRIADIGARIDVLIPGLQAGEGAALLINSYALIVGLWQQADTPAHLREAMAEPALGMFRIDFERQLAGALGDLWEGAQRRASRRRA